VSTETLQRDGTGREPDTVPAVECERLTYRYGTHTVVDKVSLQVRAGEMFGLLGPNGAGKTTTIRVLTTLLPAAEGSARIFGLDVRRNRMRIRRLLGYVPQMLSADPSLSGRENVALFARLFDVPRRERSRRVAESLEMMGLADAADRLAGTYSGGMVRRLELAQVFATVSMTIAGLANTRERLMGTGQAITMPLFFASNALYPLSVMPVWLRAVSVANPLSYEVDALRGLLLGTHAHLALD
jgi:ABC-type transport system involved in cytochrome c biogenesis ATPase subunit